MQVETPLDNITCQHNYFNFFPVLGIQATCRLFLPNIPDLISAELFYIRESKVDILKIMHVTCAGPTSLDLCFTVKSELQRKVLLLSV